jgi:diacylglycerol kinase family enzyme
MVAQYLAIAHRNGKKYSDWEASKLADALASNRKFRGKFAVTRNIHELHEVIRDYKGVDVVIASCGDGGSEVVSTAVENIWGFRPTYGLLRGGTMENEHDAVDLGKSIFDKPKRTFELGETSSVKQARNMADVVSEGLLEDHIKTMPTIDVNGRKCTNFSVGIVPRLIALYEGMTIDQYLQLEERLQGCPEEDYLKLMKEILSENGKPSKWSARRTAFKSFLDARSESSEGYRFFSTSINAEIYIDGEKLDQNPRGIYISSYEKVNIGIPLIRANILPGARSRPGKLQALITSEEPKKLTSDIIQIIRGEPITNSIYPYFNTMEISFKEPTFCNVNGDPYPVKNLKIRYDNPKEIIVAN